MSEKTTPIDALTRAESVLGKGTYWLGTGTYRSTSLDVPWTACAAMPSIKDACDCWGLVAWAFRQARTRPGYNKGGATVQDAVNVDSAIEDAFGIRDRPARKQLWQPVLADQTVALGDLLVWPSIYVTVLKTANGVTSRSRTRQRIGHVAIISKAPTDWNQDFSKLEVIQCGGRNGTHPAIKRISGQAWNNKDQEGGKQNKEWRARILRAVL